MMLKDAQHTILLATRNIRPTRVVIPLPHRHASKCFTSNLQCTPVTYVKHHKPFGVNTRRLSLTSNKTRFIRISNNAHRTMSDRNIGCTDRKMSMAYSSSMGRKCYIGIGSNMGDRLRNIEQACNILSEQTNIQLLRTSSLWQTKAMYMENQDDFLNGVLEIETTLEPHQLLDTLQDIENRLGRKRLVEKGPRTMDLDILLYDNKKLDTDRLTVPHPLMLERAFVLQPLCQLIPKEASPDTAGRNFASMLKQLPESEDVMSTQVRLSGYGLPLTPLIPSRPTQIMSILNVTPDSFSDGGLYYDLDANSLRYNIRSRKISGATIIDIGGESTRPDAKPVGEEEERARVVPVVELVRSLSSETENPLNISISIDTYHASVARAAVQAGAHIINDISGGTLDPNMLPTAAELGCPIILMHMRGDPSTMQSKKNTSYPEGVIETVGAELLSRVRAAEAAGVRRWKIILDPGIGFAKKQPQNLEILRRFAELKTFPGLEGLPWVIGASRKQFIGKITEVTEPSERTWGTAVAVAASIHGGADIIRVHDTAEMYKVALMADALWRPEI